MSRRDDDLAYGDYHDREEGAEGDRGLIGDMGRRFGFGRKENTQPESSSENQGGSMGFFKKVHDPLHSFVSDLKDAIKGNEDTEKPPPGAFEQGTHPGPEYHNQHRFLSFAPERHGNETKWYVDGCSYMYAVSVALERARHSIWILDWWLSPELYLRRPPAKNQQYRVDRLLHAAAERGVKVNIIVYKEVTQALTRKFLSPTLPEYLHSLLPSSTDKFTKGLTRFGLDVIFKSLEEWERSDPLIAPPITVSSSHTKHHLEDLHPNIGVFRHPDHLPDAAVLQSSFFNSMKNMSFTPAKLAQLPGDGLKAIYGAHEGTVMYWAHHEKLCLIDGTVAFMGGLDLCYGRWDTNQHAIADAHPGNIDRIVFPGQDFNNARMLDFQDVTNWENNKLDRSESSRMGWSDVALCIAGPIVQDLRTHFTQRWNFIYDEKYSIKATRYERLPDTSSGAQLGGVHPPPPTQQREFEEEDEGQRGFGHGDDGERGMFDRGSHSGGGHFRQKLYSKFDEFGHQSEPYQGHPQSHAEHSAQRGGSDCQITRSSAKWSHNLAKTEHSVQNAYCEIIRDSKHFVYIENQFFITATGDQQKPIKNKIGAAMVERILRAARNGEKYMMIVMIPAVPAFAGDLKLDEALGTRAIMEFQYDSINRGGHSIYEEIAREGVNPMQYLRFYNLRSYDRINSSQIMREAEKASGVSYQQAQEGYDAAHDNARGFQNDQSQEGYDVARNDSRGYQDNQAQEYQAYRPPPTANYGVYEMDGTSAPPPPQYQQIDAGPQSYGSKDDYDRYQNEATKIGGRQGLGDGRWDTVSECYMLGGEDIRNVPWEGSAADEMDAFVSEELYIHSKLLIADDQTVICGSANLNDRSQLGDHDSEIAIIIQERQTIESYMDGRPWQASKFAASLRRELFRKHLGLLKPQDMEQPDANFGPVEIPNVYDWGSDEDRQVADPLSDDFLNLWNWRAHTNTQAFGKVFHPVPTDEVKNWKQYDEYYSRFFGQDQKAKEEKPKSLYKWGHVVAENFSPGEQGVREVKEVLSTIKGTLVEMPLLFLKEEDIAQEGMGLNALTEELYT